MHLGMLLEMAGDGFGNRVVIGSKPGGLTAAEVARQARRLGAQLARCSGERVGMIDVNSAAVPVLLFGAAIAGKPFVPINYRLSDEQLRVISKRIAPATIMVGEDVAERLGPIAGLNLITRAELLAMADDDASDERDGYAGDPDDVAVLLFTSGTTGEPKAAVLRHKNLAAYIVETVEFGGADEDECAIVSVPPYHIAGISAVLSATYSGRRTVHLEAFDAQAWVETVNAEHVTHAMVVPTMLGRILDVIERNGVSLPSLRSLSYGGGPMPVPVIERALTLLPNADFVNAYGLTETSSTIALLGPDDHRAAFASADPAVRARLGSVGRPLPSVEVTIRDANGEPVAAGERGEIFVRGEQVSGEYVGRDPLVAGGWFATRDAGVLDDAGYLFIHGRLDDVIVRGGENLSPGEIEDVLMGDPAVEQAAVVGIPSREWGEQVVAAVVLAAGATTTEAALQERVRAHLRSTKTPEHIQFRAELPFNDTGKLLRRVLRDELAAEYT